MTEHLAFAPEILRRLGEELVPHPDQGVVELARNSFDADAATCIVRLKDVEVPGGSITVTDDGDGMSRDAIKEGWLILGRSPKTKRERTRLNRVPAGDKGLGRLAALRLGHHAVMRTRPRDEPGVEYQVNLDWRRFDSARVVEDVPVEIDEKSTRKKPGTEIELRDLRVGLSRNDLQRLARALVLLSDPFDAVGGFRPQLVAPGFAELEERVRAAYFDEIEYRIHAELDEDGRVSAQLLDWKGQVLRSADHGKVAGRSKRDGPYSAPRSTFDLWAFSLSGTAFASRRVTLGEVRDWLSVVGGVHVYQDNLRVPPYGDPGSDWLEMNLRRARSPELRPSTNTSVGRVIIEGDSTDLVQKTDRAGFVESQAFTELRAFAADVLEWAAAERLRDAERRRNEEKKRAEEAGRGAAGDVEAVTGALEAAKEKEASAAFKRYQRAIERQLKALREDVQLYRTLSTVGTTTSAFAHESVKPAGRIEQAAKLVRSRGRKVFGASNFDDAVGEQIEAVLKAARALSRWAKVPLHLLKRDNRRARRFDFGRTAEEVVDMLKPFLTEAHIELTYLAPDSDTLAFGPPAAAEAIVMNLVVNSINALLDDQRRGTQRQIVVECADAADGFVSLSVADSGPGIVGITADEIWLPGRTTREGGTGLGLTIVRDSVMDLGGEVSALPAGALGGAEFTVRIPMLDRN